MAIVVPAAADLVERLPARRARSRCPARWWPRRARARAGRAAACGRSPGAASRRPRSGGRGRRRRSRSRPAATRSGRAPARRGPRPRSPRRSRRAGRSAGSRGSSCAAGRSPARRRRRSARASAERQVAQVDAVDRDAAGDGSCSRATRRGQRGLAGSRLAHQRERVPAGTSRSMSLEGGAVGRPGSRSRRPRSAPRRARVRVELGRLGRVVDVHGQVEVLEDAAEERHRARHRDAHVEQAHAAAGRRRPAAR